MSVHEPTKAAGPGGDAPATPRRRSAWDDRKQAITNSPATPVYGALLGVFVLAWLIVTIDGGDLPDRREHRRTCCSAPSRSASSPSARPWSSSPARSTSRSPT